MNAVALMQQGAIVERYATARAIEATLWTQDADFEGLPNVRYRAATLRR